MVDFIGKRITAVYALTPEVAEKEGWDTNYEGVIIELEDGTILYPSCDAEGNGPGVLFGRRSNGQSFVLS